jgi:hypothetical protein
MGCEFLALRRQHTRKLVISNKIEKLFGESKKIKYCPRIKNFGQEIISIDLKAQKTLIYDVLLAYRAFQLCFFDPRNKDSYSMVNLSIRVQYMIIFASREDSKKLTFF